MFSSKQSEQASPGDSDKWMLSYADMITTLLAMFIMLTTLGKDQTGLPLLKGLESFRESLASFGFHGLFKQSDQIVEHQGITTRYEMDSDAPPTQGRRNGPDAEGDQKRTHDVEQERFQRFLAEMDRQFRVEKLPRNEGQATVDLYDALNPSAPLLKPSHRDLIWQVIPLLLKENYRVSLVVWATMPSESVWQQAAERARQVVEEVAELAGLDAAARRRLIPLGQPWRYSGFQRPVLSLIITKTEKPS